MKTITLYATATENTTPGHFGYRLHLSDPDAGIELSRRSFVSGFAVPVAVEVPANWTVAETNGGEQLMFAGETAMRLELTRKGNRMFAYPAMLTRSEAKKQGAIVSLKSQLHAVAAKDAQN